MTEDDRAPFDVLEDILHGKDAPDGSMNVCELDGFLAAIACGPDKIDESEWMPVVFGLTPIEFAAQSYDPVLIAAIRAYAAQIADELSDPEDCAYLPILFAAPDGGHDGTDWTCGFMYAMGMREKAWEALAKSRQGDLLMPLLAHEPEDFETGPPVIDEATTAFLRANASAMLAATVVGVNRFWRNRERRAAGLPRLATARAAATPKAGRNEPCPCGSGQKFKKCCGAP